MTRKIFKLCVVAAIATTFSVGTVSSASAVTDFTAPTDGAVLNFAPVIAWTSVGAFTPPAVCTLTHTSQPTVGPSACDSAPFSALTGVGGPDNLTWAMPTFSLIDTDGTYVLTVDTNFTAGGADSQQLTVVFDETEPVVAIDAATTPTNDNTPSFSFSVNDPNLGTIECAVVAAGIASNLVTTYGPCDSSTTFAASSPVADGARVFYVRATDAAGNIGYGSEPFFVDTVAPVITVLSPTPGKVMDSSIVELNFGATDIGGTGVVQPIQCRYNAEAFVPCDAAFTGRILPDGAYTLQIKAIDLVGNTTVSATPFSVNTSLDDIAEPTTPSRVKAKKLNGKVKGSKYRLKLRGSFAVPAGFDAKLACKGTVRFSIKGRLKGKKAKTFTKRARLKPSRRTCVYTATFSVPKGYKRKRLTTRTVFRGNALFGGFSKTSTIRRA